MCPPRPILALLALVAPAFPAAAEVGLDGYFIAEDTCPALQSIRKNTNPGGIETEFRRAYDLLAGNRQPPSHFLIRVPGADPERRWVAVACGVRALAVEADRPPPDDGGDEQPSDRPEHVLAASWQPGFCETRPQKTECATQTEHRFDAAHFSLHGLWPQPRGNVYCQVAPALAGLDKAGRWQELPQVTLEAATRDELDTVMPGTASFLERHEWIKHGTCYGDGTQEYFAASLRLMRDLNGSAVRDLFAASIGGELSAAAIREAFDEAFGPGAGARVRVSCADDPSSGRRLIAEITIGLSGEIGEGVSLADLVFAAAPTADAGCPAGIVDRAGLQ